MLMLSFGLSLLAALSFLFIRLAGRLRTVKKKTNGINCDRHRGFILFNESVFVLIFRKLQKYIMLK